MASIVPHRAQAPGKAGLSSIRGNCSSLGAGERLIGNTPVKAATPTRLATEAKSTTATRNNGLVRVVPD
jgi:hypothetical protein